MKTRHLVFYVCSLIGLAALTIVAAVHLLARLVGTGDGVSAVTPADQSAGKAIAKKSGPKLVPLPPRFRPPTFSDVRMLPAARPDTQEYYAQILTAPVAEWSGPVPASLDDLPVETRNALGPKAANAGVNLAFLDALQRCVPDGLRGAMVVDLFFERDKAVKADVEATTLGPEHDEVLARCVSAAHVGRYLLHDPEPDPTATSTVFPMIVQLPVRNTDVYRRLAAYSKE